MLSRSTTERTDIVVASAKNVKRTMFEEQDGREELDVRADLRMTA